jgi:hypothetical protein
VVVVVGAVVVVEVVELVVVEVVELVVVEVVVVVVVVAGTTYSAERTRTIGLSMWKPASVNGPAQLGPTAML